MNIVKEVEESIDKQKLSNKTLIGIGKTFIERHKLQDKVSKIKFNQSTDEYGYYRIGTGEININKDMIFKLNNPNVAIHRTIFTLYHELAHAMQYDYLNKSFIPDYVKEIVRTDDSLRTFRRDILNDQNQDLLPTEHNANAVAARETFIIYKKAGLVKNDFEPIYTMARHYNIVGGKVISPIEQLYKKIGIDFFECPYFDFKNIKLYNRMSWGLPVTKEEYNKVITKHIF